MIYKELPPAERFNRLLLDDRIAEVARTANEYQLQVPGMTRDEALRLAEKHVQKSPVI